MQYLPRLLMIRKIARSYELIATDMWILYCLSSSNLTHMGIINNCRVKFGYNLSNLNLGNRLGELIRLGYVVSEDKIYCITPLGLLILHKIEKRLKEARIPKK